MVNTDTTFVECIGCKTLIPVDSEWSPVDAILCATCEEFGRWFFCPEETPNGKSTH